MKGSLCTDEFSRPIQSFVPDPLKCQGAKAAGTVCKVGAGGDINIAGWLAVEFDTQDVAGVSTFAAGAKLTFNGNGAMVYYMESGKNIVMVHPNVTQIVASVACIISGM